MPNVLATTIVFKIAPSNRNMATAIWWVKKYASNWLKNLKSVHRGTCQMKKLIQNFIMQNTIITLLIPLLVFLHFILFW